MAVWSYNKPLAIVDIETTGASPNGSRILEIAIIRIENGEVVQTLNTVVDPQSHIPPAIVDLTGIKESDLRAAPTFNDISQDVYSLLEGAIFVAHNARFDYSFIKSEFNRLDIRFTAKQLCTVALSRALYPEFKRHDLSTIIERFNFTCEQRHRALGDAQVLVDLLNHSYEIHGADVFGEKILKVLGVSRIPHNLPKDIIKSLPECPGVYVFYGESGEKLYIGKSINIKKRVMSHFSNSETGKALRIAEEIQDIEAIPTTGELGALLMESYLIKKDQPLYNRMSRRTKKLVIVREDSSGKYKRAVVGTYAAEDLTSSDSIIGIFRSMSQAKGVLDEYTKEHKLCPELMDLEKHRVRKQRIGGCFYSQLGKCLGACAAKESPETYNARFDLAFRERRVKAWPFEGPVIIDEKHTEEKTKGTAFVIDQWKLVGSFLYDEDGQQPFLPQEYAFDYDSYKILASRITKSQKGLKVVTHGEAQRLLTI